MTPTPGTLGKAWALLDQGARREIAVLIAISALSAVASAVTIASVIPWLSVLADPAAIQSNRVLSGLYDRFAFTSQYRFLIFLGLISIGLVVLSSALMVLKLRRVTNFAAMQGHAISSKLMARYLSEPYEFFMGRHTSEMSMTVLAESGHVVAKFLQPMIDLASALLSVAAVIGLLMWLEPFAATMTLVIFGAMYSVVYAMSRRSLARLGQQSVTANAERHRACIEALGGVKDIKLLGREAAFAAAYAEASRRLAWHVSKTQLLSGLPPLFLQGVAMAGIIGFCLFLLSPEAQQGVVSVNNVLPTLGAFAFAGLRLMPEFSRIYNSVAPLRAAEAAVAIVYRDFVGTVPGLPARPTSIEPIPLRQQIALQQVAYTYPGATTPALRDISFTANKGARIGVIGTTGSGKSTLADLLLGLVLPSSGQILVDGTPLGQHNHRAWLTRVGYVPQEIFLADASVAQNIALGIPTAEIDLARVRRAAALAQIDTFIENELPHGYDTNVAERGIRLSGGQRQRLGIARALYNNIELLVLDEATSALDVATERDLMAAINALPGDKTIFIVAHRLSALAGCDQILELRQGRLVPAAPTKERDGARVAMPSHAPSDPPA